MNSDLTARLKDYALSFAKWRMRTNMRMRYRIYRKLQGMLGMNEALSRALERLWFNASEMGRHPFRPEALALKEWFERDRMGGTLSEAMAEWVPSSEIYMIRAGEESGTMAKALAAIQASGESARQMKEAIVYAVAYPCFILMMVSAVLWLFGVQLISNMRKYAPPKVVESIGPLANLSDFVMNWGVIILFTLVAAAVIISVTLPFWRGPIRVKFDQYPPWSWYRVWQGSGFLLGMSALLGAQVPLRRAIEILEEQGNPWMRERLTAAREEVLRGRNLGEALRLTGMRFPDTAVAVDLEILSERADVSAVIEQITQEWIRDQIDSLKVQAQVVRTAGMMIVGGIIGFSMYSILNITTAITSQTNSGGGYGY